MLRRITTVPQKVLEEIYSYLTKSKNLTLLLDMQEGVTVKRTRVGVETEIIALESLKLGVTTHISTSTNTLLTAKTKVCIKTSDAGEITFDNLDLIDIIDPVLRIHNIDSMTISHKGYTILLEFFIHLYNTEGMDGRLIVR